MEAGMALKNKRTNMQLLKINKAVKRPIPFYNKRRTFVFHPQRKCHLQLICSSSRCLTPRSPSLGPVHPQKCLGTAYPWQKWVQTGWSRNRRHCQKHKTLTMRSRIFNLEYFTVSSSLLSSQARRVNHWLGSKLQVSAHYFLTSISVLSNKNNMWKI